MPRKKVTDKEEVTPTPAQEEAPKPKRTRAKKTEEAAPKAPAKADAKAKPRARGTAKKEEAPKPEPAAQAVQPASTQRRGRGRVSQEAPPVEVVEPPKEAPKRGRSRTKKGAETPVEEVVAPAVAEQTPPEPKQEAPARSRRGRGKKTAEPDPEPAPMAAAEEPTEEPRSRSRGRRGRGRKQEPAAQPAAASDVSFENDDDLPIPVWRPVAKTTKPKAEEAQDAVSEDRDDDEAGGSRRKRRRRRGGRKSGEGPEELAAAEPEAVEAEEPKREPKEERRGRRDGRREAKPINLEEEALPEVSFRRKEKVTLLPPPKPLIPKPSDGPQVVLREGLPTIVRNGRVLPPTMFFGSSPDERRAATVLDELRMASEAGIHLHSHLVELEIEPSSVAAAVSLAGYLLKQTLQVDREAQVVFRLVFVAPAGWVDRYPKARYQGQDGMLAEPSVCDEEFWGVAKQCVQDFVRQLRMLDQKDHILGVHLDRGEWFFAEGWGYDTSKAAEGKFRDWVRMRYLDDEIMLRASWFDGDARFDNITIPPYQPEGAEGDKFVRSSRKQRRYVDYHLFLSDATVQRIGDLAYAVKEASEGYFLVGCSYGYTFEWSHPGSGHLSLGKLLRTPEIDFIAGPPSYKTREPGGSGAFPGPIDSFALNGKLFISEEDFKTSLSTGHEPDDFNPVIKTPQALESVHWRGAGAGLTHGTGMSWMDLWGNGWLKTPSIWDRASKVKDALIRRMGAGLGEPEVVVFIDERALAYLVDPDAFTLLVQNVREAALRAGVNVGFYLLSDLAHREKFPEAKVYMFLNAWDMRPELRAAIKSRLQRDGKVLFWLYSAGLFDAGRESLERAREVTGIALKPQPFYSKSGTTILNRRHPLSEAFPDRTLVGGSKLEPSYFAIPEEALVLGEYTQTGLPSFVVKEFRDGDPSQRWTSVFLGEPVVNSALIRALAQMGGAHVYDFREDVVHVRPPFLVVHCTGSGSRTIALPSKWAAFNVLQRQWAQTDMTNLRFSANDGSTQVFLIGPPEEIEHLLQLDPEDILSMRELPQSTDNTIRQDAFAFDIPMMKLGEWMEGGESDEVADEWFLRPPQITESTAAVQEEEEEDSGDRVGRRRRRRRGGRGEDRKDSSPRIATEEPTMTRHEYADDSFDDMGISVVFRKRE